MHQVTGAGRQHLTLALTMVSLWRENQREVVEGAVDVDVEEVEVRREAAEEAEDRETEASSKRSIEKTG